MRLELTRVGLLVELANHYTTKGALLLMKNGFTSYPTSVMQSKRKLSQPRFELCSHVVSLSPIHLCLCAYRYNSDKNLISNLSIIISLLFPARLFCFPSRLHLIRLMTFKWCLLSLIILSAFQCWGESSGPSWNQSQSTPDKLSVSEFLKKWF